MYTPAQNLAVHEVVETVKAKNDLSLPEKWALAQMKLDDLEKNGMHHVTDTIVSDQVFVMLFPEQQQRNQVNSYSFYSEKDGTIKFKIDPQLFPSH